MSERAITPKFLAQEFDMLREHMLDLKRACFDHYGQTSEGYKAHVIWVVSQFEFALGKTAESQLFGGADRGETFFKSSL